uniref:MAK10-like protein n=1 Tax=Tanacetum cinerariifolium TaxID=118510 RepID=A0A6L2K3L4_TANCI|nr:MAK10-like protein [Tanacetum cinerariifolium]
MFQQHQGESLSEAWTHFKDLLQKVPHHSIDLWLQVQIFYGHVNPGTRRTIDQSVSGKLHDRNAEESWAVLEDLALYDNESWNDPRDFAKPVKAISLPQDVSSTSNLCLIELENQAQHLMDAHIAPKKSILNKFTSSCEICSGPHDSQCCMENLEQAFVDYASSRIDESGGKCLNAVTDLMTGALPSVTVKNSKLNVKSTSPDSSAHSYPMEDPQCSTRIHSLINAIMIYLKQPNKSRDDKSEEKGQQEKCGLKNINTTPPSPLDPSISFITEKEDDGDVMFIEIINKYDDSREEELRENEHATIGGPEVEYFDTFFTRIELAYHKYLMCGPIPSLFLRNPIITEEWKPFVELSNMTHDLSLGVVKFTDEINEIAYKMPHKIEQYNSLSNLEKEHTKLVYLRNEEDKR